MDTRTVRIVDEEFDEMQAYRDLVGAFTQEIPEGAFTSEEFARDTSMGRTTADTKLKELVEQGVLETKLVRLDGYRRRIYWFFGEDDG